MSMILSPIRPRPTDRNSLFTIHKGDNTVYAAKPTSDLVMVSVVAFNKEQDAVLIASMLEEYKRKNGEWPPLISDDPVWLPTSSPELLELEIIKWDKDELGVYCVSNILDLITISSVDNNLGGYKITGDTYRFEMPLDSYQALFNSKYTS